LEIKHTKKWSFMENIAYEILDYAITQAIQARDEVVARNKFLLSWNQNPRHRLGY
jgi:hypothetical protein